MENSKAISPEVKGLFETIRLQAKEYSHAFEFLEFEKQRLNDLHVELNDLSLHIKHQLENAILDLNKNTEDTLTTILSKTDKFQALYNEVDRIQKIGVSLEYLDSELKIQFNELNRYFSENKAFIENEFEKMTSNIKNKIEKEVEVEMQRLDNRVNIKLRQIEGKMLSYDQKLWSINNSLSRDIKNIGNDISIIEHDIINIKEKLVDTNKLIKEEAEKMILRYSSNLGNKFALESNIDSNKNIENNKKEENLSINLDFSRINAIDNKEKYEYRKDSIDESVIASQIESIFQDRISIDLHNLKKKIEDKNETINSLKTKVNIIIFIAIISIILALSSLFV